MPLTPEQAKRVLEKDLENSIRKVGSGKHLTQAERARLLALAGGESVGNAIPYAKTIVELSEQLGVTRRTLHTWQKLTGAPVPSANGLHDVNAWREFVKENGLKNSGEVRNLNDYKVINAQLDARKKQIEIAALLRDYIPAHEVNECILLGINKSFEILRKRLIHENAPLYQSGDAVGNSHLNESAIDEAQQTAVSYFMDFVNRVPLVNDEDIGEID